MMLKKVILLALVLTRQASAQTARTGVLEKYARHKGNPKIFWETEIVQAASASSKLAPESTFFDDVSSSLGKSNLNEISWLSGREVKNNVGSTTVVCGFSSILCEREQRFDFLMICVHPKSTVKCVLMYLGSPHEFRQGMSYLVLRSKDGACVYRCGTEMPTQVSFTVEQTAVSSDEPEAFGGSPSVTQSKAGASAHERSQYAKSKADATSSEVDERADKREDKSTTFNSWFWVGPVIGAAATIIAAFIAIFRCSCRSANGSDPAEGQNSSPRPFGPPQSMHWSAIPGEFFLSIMVRAAPSQAGAAGAPTAHELSVVTIE